MNKSVRFFIPFAVFITLTFGVMYAVVQQTYRMGANDPQVQIAQDIADQISSGQRPEYYIPPSKIDISKSLALFLMIFDQNGKLIGSSATINGQTPQVPSGVFTDTKQKGETRFSWQPGSGVRSAVVVDYFKGKTSGFILVGRSLKEVEIREDNLLKMVFIGWVVTILATYFSFYILKNKS